MVFILETNGTKPPANTGMAMTSQKQEILWVTKSMGFWLPGSCFVKAQRINPFQPTGYVMHQQV